ncbi:MAG: cyanoexosortase B [Arthrospira sp. PLM2.Bin9]|nr:cyanoexosortase B [Arthrospira sp. PLM2.Bin9]TVU54138.1 MAG: cyanoexosortase B [Arthrospira sp. PLM2.Bin9]
METQPKIPVAIERNLFIGLAIALLVLLYAPLLLHWYDGWLNKSISIEHEYFSHGVIGLPFAAYIAWNNRQQWNKLPNQLHPLGGVLLGLGGVLYLSSISDLVNLSFPIILAGLCLWLKGIPGLKLQGIALLFVLLATPNYIPYLIEPLALPLQTFIANMAGFVLIQFNVPVTVDQIYLYVNGQIVEVAPHCAGLKMLFTSLYVGLMLLYWTGAIASRTKTILFLVAAALTSVVANIIRNTLLTLFFGTGNQELFDWLHEGWGGDLYSASMLGLLVILMKLMQYYFPDQQESEDNGKISPES